MDSRQQVALAPLGVGAGGQRRREAPLQHVAFRLQREQRVLDLAAGQAERGGKGLRAGRRPRPPRRARSSSRSASSRDAKPSAYSRGGSIAGSATAPG
jgi:hypothetical protein